MTRLPTVPRIYSSLRGPFGWISLQAIEATRLEVLQTSEAAVMGDGEIAA